MMSMFHLKASNIFLFLLFILTACNMSNGGQEVRINKSLDAAGFKNAYAYREKGNSNIKNSNRIEFLTGKELLKRGEDDFITFSENKGANNEYKIIIYSYKTGISTTCIFKGDELISKEVADVKPMETKPYYIYYEIVKRKYPHKMDWSKFPIPKDSLD